MENLHQEGAGVYPITPAIDDRISLPDFTYLQLGYFGISSGTKGASVKSRGNSFAMISGGTAGLFIEACFNIPTLGALYKAAALNALQNAQD